MQPAADAHTRSITANASRLPPAPTRGGAIGVVASLLVTRFLTSLFFGVETCGLAGASCSAPPRTWQPSEPVLECWTLPPREHR